MERIRLRKKSGTMKEKPSRKKPRVRTRKNLPIPDVERVVLTLGGDAYDIPHEVRAYIDDLWQLVWSMSTRLKMKDVPVGVPTIVGFRPRLEEEL